MRVILVASTEIHLPIPGFIEHDFRDGVEFADELAEQAGRLCYESWNRPNPQTASNEGYIANIIKQQHFSVLEHSSASFYIDGVSRTFTHELIRHRHLSFSEVSQRYVDVSQYDIIIPPALRVADQVKGPVSDDALSSYYESIGYLQAEGFEGKKARQAARAYLPAGLETKILVTGNMRSWREILFKRLSPAADAEFRLVAKEIARELIEIAPHTFADIKEEFEEFLDAV